MAGQENLPTSVSSGDSLTGDTSAPGQFDSGLVPTGTSDKAATGTTVSYSKTFPELIEKSLHTRRFFRPRFLNRLITLVWFGLVGWSYVSDQEKDRLTSVDDLQFFGIKVAVISGAALIAFILIWAFSDKNADD